jgi:hypothetical protein
VLHTERGFFGVLRVRSDSDGIEHSLVHGSTNHGMQYLDDRREEPQTYYHRHGPLGQAIKGLCPVAKPGEVPRRLGVVGLGTGTTAAYGAAGRWLTYFEIDPSVVRIAQDSKFFTYIADCRLRAGVRSVRIELGDARLTLADEPDGHFDLLAIDAFSSDSIPIHLITREALEMYVQKLAPHGVLMIHISNRHLDLSPVLGNLAEDGGWACLERSDEGLTDEQKNDRQWQGRYASTWVALARAPADLGLLTRDDRWKPLPTDPRIGLWTDDYSNIVAVLNWFRRKK